MTPVQPWWSRILRFKLKLLMPRPGGALTGGATPLQKRSKVHSSLVACKDHSQALTALDWEADVVSGRPQAHGQLLGVQGLAGHQQDVRHAQAGLLQARAEGRGLRHVRHHVLRLAHVAAHDRLHTPQHPPHPAGDLSHARVLAWPWHVPSHHWLGQLTVQLAGPNAQQEELAVH